MRIIQQRVLDEVMTRVGHVIDHPHVIVRVGPSRYEESIIDGRRVDEIAPDEESDEYDHDQDEQRVPVDTDPRIPKATSEFAGDAETVFYRKSRCSSLCPCHLRVSSAESCPVDNGATINNCPQSGLEFEHIWVYLGSPLFH